MKSAYQIIRKPVITEKGLGVKENQGTLVFEVAAAATKTSLPKEPMRSAKLIDGVVWDGRDPKKYAGSFRIKVA